VRFFTHAIHPRGQPDAPMDAVTAAALLPHPAGASPKALKWGYWGAEAQLCGQPGTQPIPVHPFPTAEIDQYRFGNGPGSRNAPNHFRPALYYVRGDQEHAPVSLLRTNNMPVPAVDPYDLTPGRPTSPSSQAAGTQTSRLAQIAMRSWHMGGRKATGWPIAQQRWGTR
jgi:hypothetical protein